MGVPHTRGKIGIMETGKIIPLVILALFDLVLPRLTVAADDGGRIFSDVCTPCHTTTRKPLDKIRLTREGWDEAVQRMISYGAEIPKGKRSELLDFLVRGPVPAGSVDGTER